MSFIPLPTYVPLKTYTPMQNNSCMTSIGDNRQKLKPRRNQGRNNKTKNKTNIDNDDPFPTNLYLKRIFIPYAGNCQTYSLDARSRHVINCLQKFGKVHSIKLYEDKYYGFVRFFDSSAVDKIMTLENAPEQLGPKGMRQVILSNINALGSTMYRGMEIVRSSPNNLQSSKEYKIQTKYIKVLNYQKDKNGMINYFNKIGKVEYGKLKRSVKDGSIYGLIKFTHTDSSDKSMIIERHFINNTLFKIEKIEPIEIEGPSVDKTVENENQPLEIRSNKKRVADMNPEALEQQLTDMMKAIQEVKNQLRLAKGNSFTTSKKIKIDLTQIKEEVL